ncbi:hypothetical protein HZB07_01290 [Candidatus Saganbacteria bacterium]|nr:hypothetical protein [Candidatus Saganbacteria bacterium]
MKKKQQTLINLAYSNSKYFGKHVIILDGEIYAAKTGNQASKLLEKLMRKNPAETPILTYIPKTDALILILR